MEGARSTFLSSDNLILSGQKTQFVGLDIVPLQPDLHRVGSTDLASRVTWVQANLLVSQHSSPSLRSLLKFHELCNDAVWKAYRSQMKSLTTCKEQHPPVCMLDNPFPRLMKRISRAVPEDKVRFDTFPLD